METENPQTSPAQTELTQPENPQESADKPDLSERVGIVEAILFVTGNAVEKSEICRAMGVTDEELEETLIAMKNAYGGTSPVLMNSGNYANLLSTSFGVTGYDPMDGNAIFYQENGTVKCSLLQDGYREYLDTMNRWLQEGLISTDFMTMTSNPRDPATALLISDGNALFFSSGVNQWDSYKSAAENADFELTAVPMLPKSAGEKLHFPSNSTKVSSNGAWTISSTCADPELAELAIRCS